jgi:LPXTG-site transpeptidase (sortase) family protein
MDFDDPRPHYRYRFGEDYAEPTGKRRLFVVLATLWFLAGIAFFGFAAYRLLQPSGSQDADFVFARPLGDSPVAVAAAAGSPLPPLGDQPMRVVIDKIGVNAEVNSYGLSDDGTPQVPFRSDIVAWYQFTLPPGVGGNAVFAGHYTWNGDAVFRHLGDLRIGDRVAIVGEETGQELVYRVSESALVDPSDGKAAGEWMGRTPTDSITLITCGGEHFVTDDPVFGGGYTKRQIVRAELVTTTSS